jgi:YhcH/YjgK/YiaL family protein
MIVSTINHPESMSVFAGLPALGRALEWIRIHAASATDGITELEGRSLFMNVCAYNTRLREDCAWESHRHTADVQYCVAGAESIDWSPPLSSVVSERYEVERDFEFWPNTIEPSSCVTLEPGGFVVFLPGELHRPMITHGAHSRIRKVVAKIDIRLLESHES